MKEEQPSKKQESLIKITKAFKDLSKLELEVSDDAIKNIVQLRKELMGKIPGTTRVELEQAILNGLPKPFQKSYLNTLSEEVIYKPQQDSLSVKELETLENEFNVKEENLGSKEGILQAISDLFSSEPGLDTPFEQSLVWTKRHVELFRIASNWRISDYEIFKAQLIGTPPVKRKRSIESLRDSGLKLTEFEFNKLKEEFSIKE
jgi:hypothetical protein